MAARGLRGPRGSVNQEGAERRYGICSDLTGDASSNALAMWDLLERRHGLREVRAALRPHLSYLVGESSQSGALGAALARAAAAIGPVTVNIDGLGVFDGPQPVVFLRVVRSPALLEIHSRLLDATRALWESVSPHYVTEAWSPHVTLGLRDLAPGQVGAVLADLRQRSVRFTTRLDSFNLVHVVFPHHFCLGRWELGGTPPPPSNGGGVRPRARPAPCGDD